MKKNSRRKSNLKSSIVLLLLIAILLISSSYAWFTSNQTVTISSLQVNVQATNGLQISADGTNWKAILTEDDLKNVTATYASAVNQIPAQMAPVSTVGVVTNGKMEMYYGEVKTDTDTGAYILEATKESEQHGTEGKYIAFDVFLKVDSNTQIYMTPNSKVTKVGEMDQGLQNAARVGFIIEGNTASSSTVETIQGLSLASGNGLIWEPNYDTHTEVAVAAARDYYGITTTTTGGAKLAYKGIKAEIPLSAKQPVIQTGVVSDTYFGSITPSFYTTNGSTESPAFYNLSAGVTKIRVYMWVEGQDVDCENGASGTNIKFDLQFTSTAPVGG